MWSESLSPSLELKAVIKVYNSHKIPLGEHISVNNLTNHNYQMFKDTEGQYQKYDYVILASKQIVQYKHKAEKKDIMRF